MWEDIRNLKPEMSKSESLPIFLISKESASEEGLPTIFPSFKIKIFVKLHEF